MSDEATDALASSPEARRAIGDAIQKLMAARLGRAFVPLGVLFVWGLGSVASGGAPWMAGGAIATGAAMLAYGLRIVQKSMARPHRWWMSVAMATSFVPPFYAIFLIGWNGLRSLTLGFSPVGWALAAASVVAGIWVLRVWMRVVEIERLARIMTVNPDGHGGAL